MFILKLLTRLLRDSSQTHSSRKRIRRRRLERALTTETLETRQLLAATLGNDGLLYVEGTDQADQIMVRREYVKEGRTVVTDDIHVMIINDRDGETVHTFGFEDIDVIVIDGKDGDDRLVAEMMGEENYFLQRNVGNYYQKAQENLGHAGPFPVNPKKKVHEVPRVILVGSDGNDYLSGSVHNDILIGGQGQDELDGQWGRDILIGGSTNYDKDPVALASLMDIWEHTNNANYFDQITQVQESSVPLKAGETVHDDNTSDMLRGFNEEGSPRGGDDNNDGINSDLNSDWYIVTRPTNAGPERTLSREQVVLVDRIHDFENYTGKLGDLFSKVRETFKDDPYAIPETIEHNLGFAAGQKGYNSATNAPYMMALVTDDQATHFAQQSGNWSDAAVWGDQGIPGDGARVVIPTGMTVTINRELDARVKTIRVDMNASLRFSTDRNTLLKVDTLIVMGSLEMGTEDQPIQENVTARILLLDDGGQIDRQWDPKEFSRSLIVMRSGRASIVGAAKSEHLELAQPVLSGETQLTLKTEPEHWQVGDELVIASTANEFDHHDRVTITSINGNVVHFDTAAKFDHVAPRPDLAVHVANLTRNVIIQSEFAAKNTDPDVKDKDSIDNTQVKRRGHTMFMTENSVIKHAAFVDLGRTDKSVIKNNSVIDHSTGQLKEDTGTNQEARYSLHFHRTGVDPNSDPIIVHGIVIDGNPGWGFVHHSSHIHLTDSVAFEVSGSAFNAEAGDEIGVWKNNLSLYSIDTVRQIAAETRSGAYGNTTARMKADDLGFDGHGYWLAMGSLVKLEGNVASGSAGEAFLIPTTPLHERGLGQSLVSLEAMGLTADDLPDTIPVFTNWDFEGNEYISPFDAPLLNFTGNTAYSSDTGLFYGGRLEGDGWMSEVKDFTAWNVSSLGVRATVARNVIYDGLTLIKADDSRKSSTAIDLGTRNAHFSYNVEIRNFEISNFKHGINLRAVGGRVIIEDGTLDVEKGITHFNQEPGKLRKRKNTNGREHAALDTLRVSNLQFSDSWKNVDGGYMARFWYEPTAQQLAFEEIDNKLYWEGQQIFYDLQRAEVNPWEYMGDDFDRDINDYNRYIKASPYFNKTNQEVADLGLTPTSGELAPPPSERIVPDGFDGNGALESEYSTIRTRVWLSRDYYPVSKDHNHTAEVGDEVNIDILGNVQDLDSGSNVSIVGLKDLADAEYVTVHDDGTVTFDARDRGMFSFEVTVSDDDGNTYDVLARVKVSESGNRAPTDLYLTGNTVNQDARRNTIVGKLIGTDPDEGDEVQFRLVAGEGSDDNNKFKIDKRNRIRATRNFGSELKSFYTIRVQAYDQDGASIERILTIRGVPAEDQSPSVESVVINDGSQSRSHITSLTVTFDSLVGHDQLQQALTLTNIDRDLVVDGLNITSSDIGGKTQTVLTFQNGSNAVVDRTGQGGPLGNSLVNGNYRLDIDASRIVHRGSSETMTQDYSFGGQRADDEDNDDFFRLLGDTDGDGLLDPGHLDDMLAIWMSPDFTDPELDANGDGLVDTNDVPSLFASFFGPGRI